MLLVLFDPKPVWEQKEGEMLTRIRTSTPMPLFWQEIGTNPAPESPGQTRNPFIFVQVCI
jgi:hypothetical protein